MTMTGQEAIKSGRPLWKYADAVDGARAITVEEAREIAREDPSLIYAKECTHHICEERCVMVWTVYESHAPGVVAVAVFRSVEDARAFAAASGLALVVGDAALPGELAEFADSFWRDGAQIYPHLGE